MYRPFLFFILFFVPGIVLGSITKISWIIIFIPITSFIAGIFNKNKKIRALLFAVCIFFFGTFYYNLKLHRIMGTITDYVDNNKTIVGVIANAPTITRDKVIYDVKALYIKENVHYKNVTGKIRVSTILDDNQSKYNYGDVIKFSGELKTPQGRRNPNGINYRAYLLQKGIVATAFSREIEIIGKQNTNPLMRAAFSIGQRLTDFYEANLPSNISSLMVGIALGIKDNIPRETMEAVKNGGVAHVLAVSGLHMGIIYAAFNFLFSKFRFSNIFSFIIGSLTFVFYSIMAGLSPSVIRAAIMIMVFMLAKIVGRENDSLNTLCLSSTILLLLNPLTLFSVSFQLSYSAVLGIILFFDYFRDLLKILPKYLRDSIAVIMSAQLTVAPFLIYYFHNISIIGFLTNLLVVPLVGIILVTGLVSGLISIVFQPLGSFFVKVPWFLLNIAERIILISSRVPFSTVVVPAVPAISLLLYFLALAVKFNILVSPDKEKSKYKNVCAIMLIIIALIPVIWASKGFEVTFIDVGQGDSILIKTEKRKVILIDGGGMPTYYDGDFDTGKDIIIPFLHSRGINEIDLVVFTHFDDDHAKGLISILKSMKVKCIVYGLPEESRLYQEMLEIAHEKSIKTVQVSRKDQFVIDNAAFYVLNPVKDSLRNDSSNNKSVVLKMMYKGIAFLFTGDLEREGEENLIGSGLNIQSQVLKVGHHGSHTSTSEEFLSHVKPAYAIISAGKDNNFGHPSPQVINALNNNEVKVLRTDIHGAVTFKIHGKDVKIYTTVPEEIY